MFGRKSRARKLKDEAKGTPLAIVYDGARPVVERLLYDDGLRDNIRTFIDATRKVLDEVSDEEPTEIVAKLWDDKKLRNEIEAAVAAFQDGSKRIRGNRVKSSGGSGKVLLVLALAGGAFVFLNPKTGPEARRVAGDIVGALRS